MDAAELARKITGSLRDAGLCGATFRVSGEAASVKESANGHLFFNLKSAETGRDVFLRCVMWRGARRGGAAAGPATAWSWSAPWTCTPSGRGAAQVVAIERTGERPATSSACSAGRPSAWSARGSSPARAGPWSRARCEGASRWSRRAPARAPGLPPHRRRARAGARGRGLRRACRATWAALAAADRAGRREGGADALVLTRGGGDAQDLWCFNDERVVRALAACATPTVSAVGHATDRTLVDRVADAPVAAAERGRHARHGVGGRGAGAGRGRAQAARAGRGVAPPGRAGPPEHRRRALVREVEAWRAAMDRGLGEIDGLVDLRVAVDASQRRRRRGRRARRADASTAGEEGAASPGARAPRPRAPSAAAALWKVIKARHHCRVPTTLHDRRPRRELAGLRKPGFLIHAGSATVAHRLASLSSGPARRATL